MERSKLIGIIGGVGPYAGVDISKKILDSTTATRDQEYPGIINISMPHMIADRTSFLFGETDVNPAEALAEQLLMLEQLGVKVAGIPCNTAHAPAIFDRIKEILSSKKSSIKLLSMIEQTALFLKNVCENGSRIGLLCTAGTYRTEIYEQILEPAGLKVIKPTQVLRNNVNEAIFSPDFGIKSVGVNKRAREMFLAAFEYLRAQGAAAVVLGCSEIPLAITEREIMHIPAVDPTLLLARALISETSPEKLKQY